MTVCAAKSKLYPDTWTENLFEGSGTAPSETPRELQSAPRTKFCRVEAALRSSDCTKFHSNAVWAHVVRLAAVLGFSAGATSMRFAWEAQFEPEGVPCACHMAVESEASVRFALKSVFKLGTRSTKLWAN